MKLKKSKNESRGPSSSIGIASFKESMGGPKLKPETVVAITVIIVVLIVILKAFI